jgi:hypothetical protein
LFYKVAVILLIPIIFDVLNRMLFEYAYYGLVLMQTHTIKVIYKQQKKGKTEESTFVELLHPERSEHFEWFCHLFWHQENILFTILDFIIMDKKYKLIMSLYLEICLMLILLIWLLIILKIY